MGGGRNSREGGSGETKGAEARLGFGLRVAGCHEQGLGFRVLVTGMRLGFRV